MNDEERREWVRNDEGLYSWFRRSRMGLYAFVVANRAIIDKELEAKGVKMDAFRKLKRPRGMTGRSGQSLYPGGR